MKFKISSLNRTIRIIIGLSLLIATVFFFDPLNVWLLGFGIILVTTAIVGLCPIHYYWQMKRQPE